MSDLFRSIWWTLRHDPDEPIDGDLYDRRDIWAITRPMWTHTILTTHAECGCRKRLGLWHTMWCADHVFGPRMGGAS